MRVLNFFVITTISHKTIQALFILLPEFFSSDDVPVIKFLGIFFYPDLNFKYHISLLKSKLSKALYALRTVRNSLGTNSLLLLYYSIFHCHLNYATIIWSCSRSGPINDLFKLQKSAVRIISGSSYNSHTEPLFKKLKILPLPDLITFSKKFNSCNVSPKHFYQNTLTISGWETLFATLALTNSTT